MKTTLLITFGKTERNMVFICCCFRRSACITCSWLPCSFFFYVKRRERLCVYLAWLAAFGDPSFSDLRFFVSLKFSITFFSYAVSRFFILLFRGRIRVRKSSGEILLPFFFLAHFLGKFLPQKHPSLSHYSFVSELKLWRVNSIQCLYYGLLYQTTLWASLFHNKHISGWHSRNSNTSYSFVHSICLREKSKWKQIKERLLKFPKLLDVIDSFFPAHLILVSYFNFLSSVAAVLRTTQRYVCHEARRRSFFSFLNTILFILNFWKPYDPEPYL